MHWLQNITAASIAGEPLPLHDILTDCLFYPSSGFDGGVIRECNTDDRALGIRSFILCDYVRGELAFIENQNSFAGYHVFDSRKVKLAELIPNGWFQQLPPGLTRQTYTRNSQQWATPFVQWTIYERDTNRREDHGPLRFSLLYLGGEAIATFQALFWTNHCFPKAIAIIQPGGEGIGFNYADFTAANGILEWVVNQNPYGKPSYIFYGGYEENYSLDWSGFQLHRTIKGYYRFGRGGVLPGGEVKLYYRTAN